MFEMLNFFLVINYLVKCIKHIVDENYEIELMLNSLFKRNNDFSKITNDFYKKTFVGHSLGNYKENSLSEDIQINFI